IIHIPDSQSKRLKPFKPFQIGSKTHIWQKSRSASSSVADQLLTCKPASRTGKIDSTKLVIDNAPLPGQVLRPFERVLLHHVRRIAWTMINTSTSQYRADDNLLPL